MDDSNVLQTPSQHSNTRSLVRNVQCQRPRPSIAAGHSHVVGNNDNIPSSIPVKDSCWALLEGRVGRGEGGEVLLLLGELEGEEEEGINNSSHSKEEGTHSSHPEEEGMNSIHSRSNATPLLKEPTRKTGNDQKTSYLKMVYFTCSEIVLFNSTGKSTSCFREFKYGTSTCTICEVFLTYLTVSHKIIKRKNGK
jgi:hypothetical protein